MIGSETLRNSLKSIGKTFSAEDMSLRQSRLSCGPWPTPETTGKPYYVQSTFPMIRIRLRLFLVDWLDCSMAMTIFRRPGSRIFREESGSRVCVNKNQMEEKIELYGISRLRPATDGTGIRTLICTYGCPLQCRYCINPLSWNGKGEAREFTLSDLFPNRLTPEI